jgi:hypothetical protein
MSGAVVVGEYPPPPAGPSAYELALEQGFVGTLDEWLASLVGPPGPASDQFPEFPEDELPLRADWQPAWVLVVGRDPVTGDATNLYDKAGLPA